MKTVLSSFAALVLLASTVSAQPTTPSFTDVTARGTQKTLQFPFYPGAEAYTFLSTTNLGTPFTTNSGFVLSPYFVTNVVILTNGQPSNVVSVAGYEWRTTNTIPRAFYQLQVTPMDSNKVLTATVLNRLAYGPTPDELERVKVIGPQAYIDEQLAPHLLIEDVDNQHTNINFIASKFALQDEAVTNHHAQINDLRAWHTLRAVGARRQLLEILLQFVENHFVTQHSKSMDYFDQFYDDNALENRIATQFEYLENQKWRVALLNPTCTFYDLLRISAESPAMIIYLDTVNSKGNSSNIANENYARELLELFTFGVDNGYDQNDITIMSRAWTGWSVAKVDLTNAFNPFAPPFTGTVSNKVGAWVFNYKSGNHNNNGKTNFLNKTVPARFGSPWAGRNYQLSITAKPAGTNTIQDGYQVITHLANQPFTQEYISVKLCQLLVHDNFAHGYDFTSPDLSPEGQLVRQCMLTWENGSPKGQIWQVVSTIVNSELFRSQGAASQKIKTPLEFVVSTVRALRSSTNGTFTAGSFSADTDGYAFNTPLARMGGMLLFDRSDPDGYPETAPGWVSAGTLAERIRFAQSFCIAMGTNGHTGNQSGTGNDAGSNNVSRIVDLLKLKLPAPADHMNAAKVADYFISLLFPGEGAGNLALYRQAAINFLNTNDSGSSSAFSGLTVDNTPGTTYDNRVRGMVGMLMAMQRFQEQ